MAITNYTELQASLTGWSHRADLASVLPDFITLAEAKFNRELRTRDMEHAVTITPALGVCTLPADFLEARRVYINLATQVELEYLPPEQFHIKFASGGNNWFGPSRYYTIEGNSMLLSDKTNTTDISLLYYQKIPALSANATNWLLTSHPDLYLSASMAELCDYTKDEAGMQKWMAKANMVGESLIQSDRRSKYSGSALRVTAA